MMQTTQTSAVILITRPMKSNDPTMWTFRWGEEIVKVARAMGYTVVDIKKNEATYENVSKSIQYYNPRLYIHVGHGCPSSLQGQTECIVTRKFDLDELVTMDNFREIVMPLIYGSGCKESCLQSIDNDICNPICTNETNVNLLKGKMVYTVACYSALQLGKCAVRYGADSYVGYDELMLFPVDDVGSQEIFKSVHLVFIKELLKGHTIEEAEQVTSNYEDELIRLHKKTKYIALPLLWNKLHRKILGNRYASMYYS